MYRTSYLLYVHATPLAPVSRISSTASVIFFSMSLSMLLRYIPSRICSVYFHRVLEYAIEVVPTTICSAIPGVFCGSKGVFVDILSYHVTVLVPPRIPLSPLQHKDFMDS